MKNLTTSRFWHLYGKLPQNIKKTADKSFQLLKENPSHPSLHLKKVGNFWSARISKKYRALAVEYEANLIWFWIGNHTDYDNMINS